MLVHAQAVITQLILNHSLRIRVKDGSSDEGTNSKKDEKGSKNLSGKLNNLITTDMANIIEGREFLQLGAYSRFSTPKCKPG